MSPYQRGTEHGYYWGMNKATKARKAAMKATTTMVRDGLIYQHNPATVGHEKHTAECWTLLDGLGFENRFTDVSGQS